MSDVDTHHFPHEGILVVDDTRSDLKFLSGILRKAGYTVRPASDGELALRSVRARLPALILLDIEMPGLDGYEVCRRLKDAKDTRGIPVIFISVKTSPLDKVKAFGVGGVDYISKPFEPEEVLARVATHLALWKERKEVEEKNLQLQQEIAERQRAEEALRESEGDLRAIFDSTGDGMVLIDKTGRVVRVNKRIMDVGGYAEEEIVGKRLKLLKMLPPQSLAKMLFNFGRLISGQQIPPFKVEVYTETGEKLDVELRGSPWRQRGKTVGMIGVMRDITERKRAEEAVEERNREITTLYEIALATSAILEIDELLKRIYEQVEQLVSFDAFWVALVDEERGELQFEITMDGGKPMPKRTRKLEARGSLAGWVVHTRKPFLIRDWDREKDALPAVTHRVGKPVQSWLGIPLLFRDRVVGVMAVQSFEPHAFDEKVQRLLTIFANQMAIAIENARLYEQAQRDAKAKATLLREVNHRVKNNLSAIIGLLYAERSRADVADQPVYRAITQNLINRVGGLSTVHRLLSASEWAPLLLSDLAGQVIRSSLQMLPRAKSIPVKVTPSPVRVTPDQAHNLALVINELATNTIKHALQERDTAHITVRIALEDDDTVQFEFRDDGPGYPEDVLRLERYSVGFELIQNMVRQGLQGELSLRTDHGAVAVIRFQVQA